MTAAAATHPLRILFVLTSSLLLMAGVAQSTLRIGVVLPDRDTVRSANWNEILSARAWQQSMERRPAGVPVELHFRDGGTTPANTLSAIRELVEQENIHAVVCCVTAASAASTLPLVEALPILSLARPANLSDEGAGPLVLAPGPLAIARAMALDARTFGRGVGLMTLDNDYGREIAAAVVAGLLEAGLPLARAEDYPPGTAVLTPEALLVAASEPSAVVVWGLAQDSLTAIDGLRNRGYEGPIYLPWSLAREFPGGVLNGRLRGARLVAPPVALDEELPAGHPNAAALRRYGSMLARAYGGYGPSPEGAVVFDALELLLAAGELAVVYGVDPSATASFRLALRDALIAQGPMNGAGGSYDYDGRRSQLALARGLVIATPGAQGLRLADQ